MHHGNNSFSSNNTDVILTQNNFIPEKNNNEMSKANQESLSLNFDPTHSDIESSNEDDEV